MLEVDSNEKVLMDSDRFPHDGETVGKIGGQHLVLGTGKHFPRYFYNLDKHKDMCQVHTGVFSPLSSHSLSHPFPIDRPRQVHLCIYRENVLFMKTNTDLQEDSTSHY